MKRVVVFVMVALASADACLAYIDPGTAGMVLGGQVWPWLVGVFGAVCGFFASYFWKPLKRGISGLWRKAGRR